MNLKLLFSLMFFITDCDKTLVHYENNNDITNLLSLPSSSGSNKIGYVHLETIKRNSYPSPLNYNGFPKSCCTSINEVICHGIPDSTVLNDGDIFSSSLAISGAIRLD